MSDYWVSKKKYFCKYCEIYIADDVPSRQQHEGGLRHQGNKERFVRGLYKQGERRKKDLEEEKREMVRVEQAANAAYARDVSEGNASASSSKLPAARPAAAAAAPAKKPAAPTSKFANYSTAESLGYTDPDEERQRLEAERHRTQGIVGQWEVVAPPPPPLPTVPARGQSPLNDTVKAETGGDTKEGVLEGEGSSSLPRKREADAPPAVEDGDDAHRFKVRKRTLAAGLGELWDPGDIVVKPKKEPVKDEANTGAGAVASGTGGTELSGVASEGGADVEKPKWTPKGWKRAAMSEPEPDVRPATLTPPAAEASDTPDNMPPSVKAEDNSPSVPPPETAIDTKPVGASLAKQEEVESPIPPPSTAGLFRKRKVPNKR